MLDGSVNQLLTGEQIMHADERNGLVTSEKAGQVLKRRGILAAAGAVVAGLAVKQTAQPVGAAHQPEDLGLGIINAASFATRLQYYGGVLGSSILIVGDGGAES